MPDLLVHLDGKLVQRQDAKVSVWDSGFQCGDGVYEGLRVYRGGVFQLQEHVERLFRCAHALSITIPGSRDSIARAILDTVKANDLRDDAHIRITVTRGNKSRTGMDPRIPSSATGTLVVIAEPKAPAFPKSGIRLVTSSVRRMPAQCLDPKLHTLNQLGQVMAKIEANNAGADEALMLDLQGFVAETNSANIFVLHGKALSTPTPDAIMPGLTRAFVIGLAPELGVSVHEHNISLPDVYQADEAFISGTVNQIAAVVNVDGRCIGSGSCGPLSTELLRRYLEAAVAGAVTPG